MENVSISADQLTVFCVALLEASGAPPDIAAEVARHLVRSDASGHTSHGVMHLPRYIKQVADGELDPTARPTVKKETAVTALVDGCWGFGQFSAKFSTDLSIAKARASGVSSVALTRSNHIGRLGEYTELAAQKDCVMMMMTAPVPGTQVVPPGAIEGVLGTNPISIGFPIDGQDPFCLDYATSAISGGKVWLALQRNEQLPAGVLLAPDGQPTRDPIWLNRGALFPPFGGHKGYALAVAIALLAGALTGGAQESDGHTGGGTLIVTIHAGAFAPEEVVSAIADAELARIKQARRGNSAGRIILPGEPEAEARSAVGASGVAITGPTYEEFLKLARHFDVDPAPIVRAAARTTAPAHETA